MVREAAESGRLLVVTQNGEAKAVVMGVAQYNEWRRTLALFKMLAQGEADIASNRVVDQTEVFRRAETPIRRASDDVQGTCFSRAAPPLALSGPADSRVRLPASSDGYKGYPPP